MVVSEAYHLAARETRLANLERRLSGHEVQMTLSKNGKTTMRLDGEPLPECGNLTSAMALVLKITERKEP